MTNGELRALLVSAAAVALAVVSPAAAPQTTSSPTTGLKFSLIPAGSFTAGSPETEKERSPNETQHRVTLTKPFWLSTTHVTVAQFEAFVRDTGHRTTAEVQGFAIGMWDTKANEWPKMPGKSGRDPGFPQASNHPVVCVTWDDAQAFCAWLNKKEGRAYRLPTEAEWEYACRAGSATAYPWGDNPDDGKGWANCSDLDTAAIFPLFPTFNWRDGFQYTAPVASFRANAWGLHDMIGNTLQWCSDWYGDYPTGAVENPTGPAEGGQRILRGGAYIYGPRHCRSAFRGRNFANFANFYIGFRIARDALPGER
jgi:sulfatase modifying factor 1